jgi:hypothetical protein
MLGTFASFGGIGYAASGASHAAQTLADLATAKKVKVHSAAADQYGPPPKAQPAATQAAQPAAAEAVAQARALPFTGLSLVGTALLGIALIAIGLALRRRERRAR